MNKLRKIFLWQYMLNKRLFHKKSFIVLLVLIPVMVFGMKLVAKQDSGIMTIMLCAEQEGDELAEQIIEELLEQDSVIRYTVGDVETAYSAVQAREVDCAWVFREDFRQKLDAFATEDADRQAPVYIIAQEDNVALMMARTNLYGVMYSHYAYYLCENFLQNDVMQEEPVSEEELRAYFEKTAVEESIFFVEYIDQKAGEAEIPFESQEKDSLLMIPMKGLLVVFILLCGLASAMYYLQDEEKGIFAWIPAESKWLFSYGYLTVAMLDAAVVVLFTLCLLQKQVGIRDVFVILLYVGVCAVFCNLLRVLCGKAQNLGRWLPLLIIVMLVACPIFLDFGKGFVGQYFFPPTYYLRAWKNDGMLLYMCLYSLVLGVGTVGLSKLREGL